MYRTQIDRYRSARQCRGQASVMGIALALMLMAGLFALYNVGQTTTEKTRLVNATDAAAYSSGVQLARNLNFLAYSNRAMIANHMAVGHATSYVSWVNYLDEVVDDLNSWLFWVPYVGQVTNAANQFLSTYQPINETVGQAIAVGSQGLNAAIYAGQLDAQAAMSLSALNRLQDEILLSYGPNVRRVPLGAGTMAGSATFMQARARQFSENAEMLGYLNFAGVAPGNDGGVMQEMVARSTDYVTTQRPTRWQRPDTARNWRFTLWPFRVIKDGFARPTLNGNRMGWDAEDRLRFQVWGCRWFSCRYRTRGEAVGTADTADWGYDGIFRYVGTRNNAPTRNEAHSATVIAELDLGQASLMRSGPGAHDQASEALVAVSCAEVHFHRPDGFAAFGSNQIEYANVFNPFWKVRLRRLNDCGNESG
jgi:hypothetical protein